MQIIKTKFSSFALNGKITEGCKYCVKGQKLVLFITGRCSRNCFYCSLSNSRKNKDIIFANEKKCRNVKEVIKEAIKANALGAGVTGGDPLICHKKTANYIKSLKKYFGRKFHIHIYLPTERVNENNLKILSRVGIDEARFHPKLSVFDKEDIKKIRLARKFNWKIGIEIPAIPGLEKNIFKTIYELRNDLDFLNINEFEISDTNFNFVIEHYNLNKDTYTIKNSKKTAFEILHFCRKLNIKFPVHFCTAKTKNLFQYRNRVKRYAYNLKKPYEILTEDYNLLRAELYPKKVKNGISFKELRNLIKHLAIKKNEFEIDRKDKRILTSFGFVFKNKKKLKEIFRIYITEYMPTSDNMIVEKQEI